MIDDIFYSGLVCYQYHTGTLEIENIENLSEPTSERIARQQAKI